MRRWILLLASVALFQTGCFHKRVPSHEEVELQKRVEEAQKQRDGLAEKLKNAKNDEGLEIQLRQDEALATGRVDRLKAMLQKVQAAHKDD